MKQEVIYEFKEYTENCTLVLNNPAEITFINQQVGGGLVIINNTIRLAPSNTVVQGIADYYDRITLKPNLDEIDTTDYNIKFTAPSRLIFICKYYRK